MAETLAPRQVEDAIEPLGVQLSGETVAALVSFGNLFLHWNTRINLGGRIGPADLAERHYTDAVVASRFVGDTASVVDVGSGGGLPILPLALLRPRARFELHEPVGKKVTFLRTAIRELGLGSRVSVVPDRIELTRAPTGGGTFDVATSRATFAPVDWLPLGRILVRPGGRVLVYATGVAPEGCPAADREFQYARDRKLLVYEVAEHSAAG